MEHLIKDTKKRTAQRHEDDKMHPLSQLAILSGFIAAGAVLYWLGAIVDAFIGLVNLG